MIPLAQKFIQEGYNFHCPTKNSHIPHSAIAFDERNFLASTRLVIAVTCVCMLHNLPVRRAHNYYEIAHEYNAANTHAQDSTQPR